MSVDKLQVQIDTTQVFPELTGVAIRETMLIADSYQHATTENIWIEPISKTIACEPHQFVEDMRTNSDITRLRITDFGKTTADTTWQEVVIDSDVFMQDNGTNSTITTNKVFDINAGFLLQFQVFGREYENFEALNLTFGQWTLKVWSNGEAKLYVSTVLKAKGYITGSSHESLCGRMVELVIMPHRNQELLIMQARGLGGFRYRIPDADFDAEDPQIIESNEVTIKAPSSAICFQLTELVYDSALDYIYISPEFKFHKAPVTGQVLECTFGDSATGYNCSVVGTVISATTDDALVPDGIIDSYRVKIEMVPLTGTMFISGVTVSCEPLTAITLPVMYDVTADVTECSLNYDGNPSNTSAKLVIRNPEDYGFYGRANAPCRLVIGAYTLLEGVLKEPATYSHSKNGIPHWECEVVGYGKFLSMPCLCTSYMFDGVSHVEAVQWLCQYIGMDIASYLSCDTDDMPLPDTRKEANSEVQSKLQPAYGDDPEMWIAKITDETGWQFTDGIVSGVYKLLYIDPFNRDNTSVWTFNLKSNYDTANYQRVYSWDCGTTEAECNEFHVIGCNNAGEGLDACYLNATSQDATVDVSLRDIHWLGVRKIAVMQTEGRHELGELEALAYRIGSYVTKATTWAKFEADYIAGLAPGQVVTIAHPDNVYVTGIGWTVPGMGTYRITSMQIKFEDESCDVPVRTALYECVGVE